MHSVYPFPDQNGAKNPTQWGGTYLYRYENIPRNERICHFCASKKIEDENHFLLDCKAYSQIRDIFFSKLETKIPDFKSLSHDTLISLLMNSSDYLINCQLVSFISQCFELRTKLISMNE